MASVEGGGMGRGGPPVLSQEVGVVSLRASVYVWISSAIGLVSFLFHIIAFSLADWIRDPNYQYGIWKMCSPFICIDYDHSSIPGSMRTIQAFVVIALLLMVLCLCVTVVLILKVNVSLSQIILIAAHGLTALCLLIAFSVCSGEFINKLRFVWPGAAFGLEIVCFLMEITAAVGFFLNYYFLSGQ